MELEEILCGLNERFYRKGFPVSPLQPNDSIGFFLFSKLFCEKSFTKEKTMALSIGKSYTKHNRNMCF